MTSIIYQDRIASLNRLIVCQRFQLSNDIIPGGFVVEELFGVIVGKSECTLHIVLHASGIGSRSFQVPYVCIVIDAYEEGKESRNPQIDQHLRSISDGKKLPWSRGIRNNSLGNLRKGLCGLVRRSDD